MGEAMQGTKQGWLLLVLGLGFLGKRYGAHRGQPPLVWGLHTFERFQEGLEWGLRWLLVRTNHQKRSW